jgi:ParB-like chromosome segregation protein Spo0J
MATTPIDKKDWPWGLAKTLKEAERKRKKLLSEDADDLSSKVVARRIKACRINARCRHEECPVCSYRSEVARRRLFQSAAATVFVGKVGAHLRLDALRVMPNRRPIDPTKLLRLKSSMREIGQLYPIIVREHKGRHYIVAGLHRYESAKALGWNAIWCTYSMGGADETEARLILLSENLARVDLRVLDWAEYVEEWRLLVRRRLKEGQPASPGVFGSPKPGGVQPREACIKKTAKALGFSTREVRRARVISSLAPEAKEAARGVKLDNNQTVLLEVAALPSGVQSNAIQAIAARRASEAKTPQLLAAKLARAEAARLEATIARDETRLSKLSDALATNKKLLVKVHTVEASGSDGATVQVRGPSPSPYEHTADSPPTSPEVTSPAELPGHVGAFDTEALEDLRRRFEGMRQVEREILMDLLPRYESAPAAVREKFLSEIRIVELR